LSFFLFLVDAGPLLVVAVGACLAVVALGPVKGALYEKKEAQTENNANKDKMLRKWRGL
jgi:hypothetical protein